MPKRDQQIKDILKDLRSIEDPQKFDNQYAVKENIAFFTAARSMVSYLRWVLVRAPTLDVARLLELSDLPFSRWDHEMHTRLIALQKKPFPGLVKPLAERIFKDICNADQEVIIGNLGCGGMEAERQIIAKLLREPFRCQVSFIGIDTSLAARQLARENLAELGSVVEIHEMDTLDRIQLDTLRTGSYAKFVVVLCGNDIFKLDQAFPAKQFDVLFHSLFKHHLTSIQKEYLDKLLPTRAKVVYEYDGYRSWPHLIPHTLTGWNYPPLLNGAVFSNLRYSRKKELRNDSATQKISFFSNTGHYLKEYHNGTYV